MQLNPIPAIRSAGVVLLAAALGLMDVAPAVASPDSGRSEDSLCREAAVPSGDDVVAGTLCSPPGRPSSAVMVLVAGATYGAPYWDVDVDPDHHNFRLAMNRAGYSTFAVDKLGTGNSSVPPSALVTTGRQAEAVHDVIGALRAGNSGVPRFPSVVLGGHSLGSTIVVTEASRYRDVDAVMLSGYGHTPNVEGFGAALSAFVPATTERRFAGRDPGYLTTRPGTRSAFYGKNDVTPEMAEYDESTKEAFSSAEIPDAVATLVPAPPVPRVPLPPTDDIAAPVLLVTGSDDRQFCIAQLGNCTSQARLDATERPFFGSAASFESRLIPGSGHDLTLSTQSAPFQDSVADWVHRTVPLRDDT